jgi:hypothetical protein
MNIRLMADDTDNGGAQCLLSAAVFSHVEHVEKRILCEKCHVWVRED